MKEYGGSRAADALREPDHRNDICRLFNKLQPRMTTRATLTGPTTPVQYVCDSGCLRASVPMWESIDVVSAELAARTSLCSLQYICPYPRSLLLRRLTCMKDPSGGSRD